PNTTSYDKPQPISVGLVIDFTNGTLKGFPFTAEIKITEVTQVAVHFAASDKVANNTYQIDVGIDRVTVAVLDHPLVYKDYGSSMYEEGVSYSLKCKPT